MEAFCGKFWGFDFANDNISQTWASSCTGGIHQAETSDLKHV